LMGLMIVKPIGKWYLMLVWHPTRC